MRIGVNLLFLIPGEVGGTEVYTRELLKALSGHSSKPDIVLFTNNENNDSFGGYERKKISVNATSRPRRVIAERYTLPRVAADSSIDVLFSPGYTSPARSTVPLCTTIHDVQFKAVPEGFSVAQRIAHGYIVGRSANAADAILTVSEFSRGEITRYLGVPEERVFVAHHGAPHLPDPNEASPVKPPFMLAVGNTYLHKNTDALVRALDGCDTPLVMVGQPRKGEPKPHPKLIRLHRVEAAALAALYRDADLFVTASLYEGFGLPVLEAMAAGLRVVASRHGAIPEVLGNAGTYIADVCDPDSIAAAIQYVSSEPADQRNSFIQKGLERAAEFTWAEAADKTMEAFHAAIARRAPKR